VKNIILRDHALELDSVLQKQSIGFALLRGLRGSGRGDEEHRCQ
jgi:hypothetical protein